MTFTKKASLLWILGTILGLSLLALSIKLHGFYVLVKTPRRGWSGIVHSADPVLGLIPIPGARGARTFHDRKKLKTRFDQYGFRIPYDAPQTPEISEMPRPI